MPTPPEFAAYPAKQNRGRRASDRRSSVVNWGAIAVVITLLAALLSLASRITALETQQRNDTQRLERIENKIDRVFERVK